MITEKILIDFLINAKTNTYASSSNTIPSPFPHSKMLTFESGDLTYRDLYFGMSQFAGQEVVLLKDNPIWSMVYSSQKAKAPHTDRIYSFLKTALLKIPADAPYRGPPELMDHSGLRYRNIHNGDIGFFSGEESIWHEEILLYRLYYSGGWLL